MEKNYTATTRFANDNETARLFDAFRNGDQKAFSGLYDLHAGMLYNYGYRLTTDMELLKDCIQDVFVKIYHKQFELEAVQNFKSYILISLKNKLCDESRRRVHLSDAAVDELDVAARENVEADYIAHEKEQAEHKYIRRLMDKLSPRQRKAIELYYIEERKYEDICDILEMNYQSVRNLIHRGISRLRTCACM